MKQWFILIIGFLALSPLQGIEHASELDQEGRLYTLSHGLLGEFIETDETQADLPVLVLGLQSVGSQSYSVVPGTEGETLGAVASLVHDDFSDTTFVVWEKQRNALISQIYVSRFQDQAWSEPIAVLANPFSQKLDLQIHILRSRMEVGSEEEEQERVFLHILWREPHTDEDAIIYAPMIFVDGQPAPGRPSFNLEELLGPFDAGELSSQLFATRSHSERQALSGATIDDLSGQLVTFKLEELPDSIRYLADQIRGHIIGYTVGDLSIEANRRTLAESARAHIIGYTDFLHPAALGFLGDEIETLVLASDADQLSVADLARAHIVGIGVDTINLDTPPALDEGWILEIDSGLGFHYLDLQPILSQRLPENWTSSDDDTLLVSRSASAAAITRIEDSRVSYIILTDEGWSDPFAFDRTEGDDADVHRDTIQRLIDRL